MDLEPEALLPERMPFGPTEQVLAYHRLLIHVLSQADMAGFRVAAFVCCHGPSIDQAVSAAIQFNQRRYGRRMIAWAFLNGRLVEEEYEAACDHAAGWETSHMLALHPDTVNMDNLPPRGEPILAVEGKMPPQDATAEFGREIIDAAVDTAVREVGYRLDHPELYAASGHWFRQGLWRESSG